MTSPATMQLERDLSWRREKGKGKENTWKGRVTKLPPLEETRVFPSLPWWIWGGSKAWLWPSNAGHPIHQMAHSGNLHHNSPGSDPPTRHEGNPKMFCSVPNTSRHTYHGIPGLLWEKRHCWSSVGISRVKTQAKVLPVGSAHSVSGFKLWTPGEAQSLWLFFFFFLLV